MPENSSSGAASGTSVSLIPVQRAIPSFKEEITILVDCGYLVLQTRGDNSHISLDTLSFYQHAAVSQPTGSHGQSPLGSSKIVSDSASWRIKTPSMQLEHLVFSTQGTHGYPLLTVPLISRYICQNRVVLTGNNSTQLVLDRFELQRLTHRPVKDQIPSHGRVVSFNVEQQSNKNEQHNNNKDDETEIANENRPAPLISSQPSARRQARDTTIFYKSPLMAGE